MIIVFAMGAKCRHLPQGKMQTSAINAHSPELIPVFHTIKLLRELQKYCISESQCRVPCSIMLQVSYCTIIIIKREKERPMNEVF